MSWDKLSMADRAKYIAIGVQNGITSLNNIRNAYNSYDNGGYIEWKQAIQKHKGIDIDNDNTYDYEGFYKANPSMAWDMLNQDSEAHFTDTFKTGLHPSFSEESIYSGYRNRFNPNGVTGGRWIDDNNYILSQSQIDNNWDTDATLDYFDENEKSPVNLYAPDGSRMLRSVTVTPQSSSHNRSYAYGGNIYDGTTQDTQQMMIMKPKAYARLTSEIDSPEGTTWEGSTEPPKWTYVDYAGRVIPTSQMYLYNTTYSNNRRVHKWEPSLKSTGQDQLERADQRMIDIDRGDEYASQFSAPAILGAAASGMNFLSPSQQVGAIIDWAQGEKGYWEGIGEGNSGFFTDKFALEHPWWTLAGNIAGDSALGLIGLDAIELATTGTSKLESIPRLLRANMPRRLPRGKDYRYRVVSDLENPGDAQRAIDNANATGIISSNPEGTYVVNGPREHYIGPYFSEQLPPMDKTSKVIVGNTADPNIQWMEIAPHEANFRMTKGTSQYTPLYNGVPNTAPTSSFKYYTRGNNFLTRKFWFENSFQPAELPDVGLFNYGKESNNMVHMDFGDYKGFTDNGAYIKNNTLFPGTPPEGQRPFIWFNKGKPYTEGINGHKYTRAFVADADKIPGIEQVRKMTEPVGQWDGSKGLVLKSEYVTPYPIDLELSKGVLFNIDPVTGRITIVN